MGKEVVKLTGFIENNKGRLKYLISDRVSIPNSIIRKLNKEEDIITENLRTVTIENIAKNIVMGYYAYAGNDYDKEDILTAEEVYLIHDILLSSKEDKIYGFLPKTSISLETSREILRVINILREGKRKEGVTTKIDPLISDLEKKLEDRKLLDKIGILNEAVKIIEESSEVDIRRYLAISGEIKLAITDYFAEKTSYLEKRFLDALCGKLGINVDIVCMTDNNKSELHFVKAYGQYNEVEYCIEEIKNKGINFGEAGIYYTDEIYENFIKAACEKNNIGVTFKKANAGDNEIIRLLIDLIESIEADFSYEILGRLVNNQTATLKHIIKRDEKAKAEALENEVLNEETIYDEEDEEQGNLEKENTEEYKYSLKRAYDTLLRRENIGWSKARYEDFFKRHESIGEFSTLNERENAKIQPFKEFLRDFIDIYDEENTAEKTYLNLLEFAKKYSYNNKNKNTYLKALRELAIPFGLLGKECKEDQLSIIKDALVNFKFGQPEEMDKVRAQRLIGRCVAERPYNFILGLATSYVLQDTANSPVLSDDEIKEVLDIDVAYVPLAGSSNQVFKEELEYLLATCPAGETTLIYSYYDTLAFKELSPSLFYLTKLNEGAESESTYKPHKTGYRFNKCLENVEDELVKEIENKGEEYTFVTESLSATTLETLVKCPFKYYYQKILNIAEPDNNYNGETWLNASEKGTFFHRIMELYCKAVFPDKYAGETTFSQEEFDKAYNKALKETEIKVPYISECAKNVEAEAIKQVAISYLEELHRFYEEELTSGRKWMVLGCELGFGKDEGSKFRVIYNYDDKVNFDWKGSIDRLDGYMDAEGIIHLKILDYKTGKMSKLKEGIKGKTKKESKKSLLPDKKLLPPDMKLQHFIYGMAGIEYVKQSQEALKEKFGNNEIKGIKLDKVFYDFPFEHNKNNVHDATNKLEEIGFDIELAIDKDLDITKCLPQKAKNLLVKSLSELNAGNIKEFMVNAETYYNSQAEEYSKVKDGCSYCGYTKICRRKVCKGGMDNE